MAEKTLSELQLEFDILNRRADSNEKMRQRLRWKLFNKVIYAVSDIREANITEETITISAELLNQMFHFLVEYGKGNQRLYDPDAEDREIP